MQMQFCMKYQAKHGIVSHIHYKNTCSLDEILQKLGFADIVSDLIELINKNRS